MKLKYEPPEVSFAFGNKEIISGKRDIDRNYYNTGIVPRFPMNSPRQLTLVTNVAIVVNAGVAVNAAAAAAVVGAVAGGVLAYAGAAIETAVVVHYVDWTLGPDDPQIPDDPINIKPTT